MPQIALRNDDKIVSEEFVGEERVSPEPEEQIGDDMQDKSPE